MLPEREKSRDLPYKIQRFIETAEKGIRAPACRMFTDGFFILNRLHPAKILRAAMLSIFSVLPVEISRQ